MSSKNYVSTANNSRLSNEREPLFSVFALLGVVILVAVPLLLIFPEKELAEKVTHAKLGDPVTVSYLLNLLRTDPHNFELRILLARHQIYLGELNDIPDLLAPVLQDKQSASNLQAQIVELNYLAQWVTIHQDDFAGCAHKAALWKSKVHELNTSGLSSDVIESLAEQAARFKEYKLVEELFREASKIKPDKDARWYEAVAKRMLSLGEYESAADFYFMARHKTRSVEKQREYFKRGIETLMSGRFFVKSMQEAEVHLGSLSADSETLYFLAKTALAAGDIARAQYYAKNLLHLSANLFSSSWWAVLQFNFISEAYADELFPESSSGRSIANFNAEHYDLAYRVFLANKNLLDAYRVAEVAVQKNPESLLWRNRFAQIAEWSGKPEVAILHWVWLMNHGGSHDALMAVLRLAPGLQDSDALLQAWKLLVERQHVDAEQAQILADAFERSGRTSEGVVFFEQQYLKTHQNFWLEREAYLAERSGDDGAAFRSYQRLLGEGTFSPTILFRLVAYQLRQGMTKEALALLNQYQSSIAPDNQKYWKLLADLAWHLQSDADASAAYLNLETNQQLALEDISRYIYLQGEGDKSHVAALAELGYSKFDDVSMLLYALELYSSLHDFKSQQRLFDSAIVNRKIDLQFSGRFYLLRAQFMSERGNRIAAKQDLERAVQIAPNDKTSLNALFWFSIDTRDKARIRNIIKTFKTRHIQGDPLFLSAFASAYQVLEQPQLALKYLTVQYKNNPTQDYLWLLNYADVLEQTEHNQLALRIRRHAAQKIKTQKLALGQPLTRDMQAAVQMVIYASPADTTQRLMRSLLRQDRVAQKFGADDAVTQAILAWSLSKEQQSNAKAWLWTRYAKRLFADMAGKVEATQDEHGIPLTLLSDLPELGKADMPDAFDMKLIQDEAVPLQMATELQSQLLAVTEPQSPPAWAQIMIALDEGDTENIGKLLQREGDAMSIKNRSDAAFALGSVASAQTQVFDGLIDNPEDVGLQSRLLDWSMPAASYIEATVGRFKIGSWQGTASQMRIEVPLAQRVRAGLLLSNVGQSNSDGVLIPPTQDQIRGGQLKVQSHFGASEFQWLRRREYAQTDAWSFSHIWPVQNRVEFQARGQYHAESNDTLALRAFGMQNEALLGLNYRFGLREYLSIQESRRDYFTQRAQYLGSANRLDWELGHRIRIGAPDWSVSLHGSHQNTWVMNPNPLWLPINSQLYSACSSWGQSAITQYSQSWSMSLRTCLTENPAIGVGYNMNAGLSGPLIGRDQLAILLAQGTSGTLRSQGLLREMTVRYRYFYD